MKKKLNIREICIITNCLRDLCGLQIYIECKFAGSVDLHTRHLALLVREIALAANAT